MKKFQFKAWDGHKWHYENIFLSHDGVLWYRKSPTDKLVRVNWKVCFNTGIKDKNKQFIYEGDCIKKWEDFDNMDYDNVPSKWILVILWNEEENTWRGFEKNIQLDMDHCYSDDWSDDDYYILDEPLYKELEVFGNVCSNPELFNESSREECPPHNQW